MARKVPASIVALLAVVCAAGAAAGCRQTAAQPPALKVVASFYPLYFFAHEIAGDDAEVVNVTPPGSEPHDYEPSAQDMARMESAGLLILNGDGLEAWGDRVVATVDPRRTRVVVAGEGLATGKSANGGERVLDPHVWLSPPLARAIVEKIERGFDEVDPRHAGRYVSRARVLDSSLRDLDAAYREGLAHCAKTDIVTSHAAFGYLAAEYHLNQVSIAGLSPDAEPSPRQLAAIAEFVKTHDETVIFFENLVSPRLSETLAMEVGAKTMVLDPLEGLTGDDAAAGKTYFTQMRQNLASLESALQCTPSTTP
jgi:zinc transport system substrate-binding protein